MKRFEVDGTIYEVDDSVDDATAIQSIQDLMKPAPEKSGVGTYVNKALQSAAAAGSSIPEGILGIGEAGARIAETLEKPVYDLANSVLGTEAKPVSGQIADAISTARQGYGERAAAARPDVSDESSIVGTLLNVPESVVTSLTPVGGTLAAGKGAGAAASSIGALVGGQAFGEAQDEGLSVGQSLAYGVAQGATETAFEMIPLGKLFDDLNKGTGLGKMLLNQLYREVPTEQATTALQDLNEWATMTPDKPFAEYLAERPNAALQTLVATVAQTGAMTGGASLIDRGLGYLKAKAERDEEEKISQEILTQATEMGLVPEVDEMGMTVMPSNHHTNDGASVRLPPAIPMSRNAEGVLTNSNVDSANAEMVPIAGEDIKIIEGSVADNAATGEIAFNPELKEALETGTFSDPDAALKIAAQLQLISDGITHLHQVDENGQTTTQQLYLLKQEELMQQLESLRNEQGLPVTTPLVERGVGDTVDMQLAQAQISQQEELRYRMLNPITPERRAELLARQQRMEQNKDIPDDPLATDIQTLDSVWARESAKGTFDSDETVPDAGGITDEVATAREERYDPELLPPSMRPIQVASIPEAEGLTLRKIKRQGGTFGIGGNERSFPREYQEAVVKLAEAVRTKYMAPDTMLVINFENFASDRDIYGKVILDEMGNPQRSVMGAHFRLKDGTHVITPRELASWDRNKQQYNKLTTNEAIYSLSHELGHAVWLNEFYRDLPSSTQLLFQNLFAVDDLAAIEANLGLLPPDRAAVVGEWLDKRKQINSQDARWFMENWVGVRKLGLGVGKYKKTHEQRIYAWAERELAKRGMRLDGASAKDIIHAMYWDDSLPQAEAETQAERYILSFTEYMAEQFTRHVYATNLAESTLKSNPFFMRALNALRQFFRDLKTSAGEVADAIVKPGEEFGAWVESLSHLYGNIDNAEVKLKRKPGRTKTVQKARAPKTDKIVAAEPDEASYAAAQAAIEKSFKAVLPLVKREDPYAYDQLVDLISVGNWEDAGLLVREVLGREIAYDKTYTTKLLNALPRKPEYSMEFLVNFAKQPWVRKPEQQAIAGLLDEFGMGAKIPREAVEAAIMARVLPLTPVSSSEYVGFGHDRANLSSLIPFTTVLATPENTWFSHHFGIDQALKKVGNYLAHFRGGVDLDTKTLYITEAQSDVLQKLGSKRSEELRVQNQQMEFYAPGMAEKLKGLQKNWSHRILQEISAWARAKSLPKVRIPHENVVAKVEGWISQRRIDAMQWGTKEEVVIDRMRGVDVQTLGFGTMRLSGKVTLNAGGDMTFTAYVPYEEDTRPDVRFEYELTPQELGWDFNYWARTYPELYAATLEFQNKVNLSSADQDLLADPQALIYENVNGQPPINLRDLYKKQREFRELAQSMYGAVRVEENGNIWYEYSVVPEMDEVLAFDATKPNANHAKAVVDTMSKFKSRAVNRSMNFAARAALAMTQLQQLAATNPDVIPLKVFNAMQQEFTRFKNQLMFRPQTVTQDWMKLPSRQSGKLEALLRAERDLGEHRTKLVKVGGFWQHQSSPAFLDWMKSQSVNVETAEGQELVDMMLKIKNSHQHQFNVLEQVLRDLLWKRYKRDTAVFGEKWREYQGLFDEMRSKPFLPNMQFGNYVLYVQDKVPDAEGKLKMTTVFRRHFESKAERDEVEVALKKAKNANQLVLTKDLTDSQSVTMAIPFDFIQAVADTGNFTQEQVTLLQEMLIPARAEKFQKRWEQVADSTPGASENLFRNYAAYSWHNANFIAKLKFNAEFNRAIAALRSDINRLKRTVNIDPVMQQRERDRLQRLLDNMMEVKQDLMYPAAEFEALRSGIALMYLNFMIKTAIMNFSTMFHTVFGGQVEYGEVPTVKAFTKALTLIRNAWGSPTESGGLKFSAIEEKIKNARGAEESYWRSVKYALDRATTEGIIDQSFAYMLAGMATSGTRMKMYQKYPRSRYIHNAIDAGMIPFRAVEKTNRLVSLLTFFQLELEKNGGDAPKAYEHAAARTLVLQNDYSKGNRPKLLRGKKSLVTIFLSYAQFIGWLSTGGHDRTLKAEARQRGEEYKGPVVNFTARMWMMYLMLGGLMGLPFAENVIDLLNFFYKKFFNGANLEYDLRKFVADVTGHESVVMHGLLHNTWTPLGNVDLSASFGAGRLIPGTGPLGEMMPDDKLPEVLGKTLLGVTGVFGSFVNSLWEFAAAEAIDDKMKALPGIAGQIGKALDGYANGIMTRSGVRLIRDEATGEFIKEDAGLAALQIMGFNPAAASQQRQQNSMAYTVAEYYATKRQMLMRTRNLAMLRGEASDRTDADKDIEAFNKSLPKEFYGMQITQKQLNTSFKRFRASVDKKERGEAPNRQQRGVYREVDKLYGSDE